MIDLLAQRAATQFVGRDRELAIVLNALKVDPYEACFLNFWGESGVGKSMLLERCMALAEAEGVGLAFIDAERVSDAWTAITELVEQLPKPDAASETHAAAIRIVAEVDAVIRKLGRASHDESVKSSGMEESVGQAAGTVSGAVAGTFLGLPLLSLIGGAAGGVLGKGVGQYVSKLSIPESISDEDLKLLDTALDTLTAAVIQYLEEYLATDRRLLIILDQYESASPQLDTWLREVFLPALDIRAIVIVAGRVPLRERFAWSTLISLIEDLEVERFTEHESERFWAQRGVKDPIRARMYHDLTQGHPYKSDALASLMASRPSLHSASERELRAVVDAEGVDERMELLYLREVADSELTEIVRVVAIARWFDGSVLREVCGIKKVDTTFGALALLSFVQRRPDSTLAVHPLAREAFRATWNSHDPVRLKQIHASIAAHLADRRIRFGDAYISDEIHHRLSADESAGLDFITATLRRSRALSASTVEAGLMAELAVFEFETQDGLSWRELALAYELLAAGSWDEAAHRLRAAVEPSAARTDFRLWRTILELRISVGRGEYLSSLQVERALLRELSALRANGEPSYLAMWIEFSARHIETAAILSRFDIAFESMQNATAAVGEDRYLAARLELAGVTACRLRGYLARGYDLAQAVIRTYEWVQDVRALCHALIQAARLETHLGRWFQALAMLQRAADLERESPDRYDFANILLFKGNVLRRRGELEGAMDLYDQALELHLTMHSAREIGPLYGSIGLVHLARGDFSTADRYLKESYLVKQSQEYVRGMGITRRYQGLLALAQGRIDEARENFSNARQIGITTSVRYLVRASEFDLTRCAMRDGGTAAFPVSSWLAGESEYSDIRNASALYAVGSTLEASDERAVEAVAGLVAYNPHWALQILDGLRADVATGRTAAGHRLCDSVKHACSTDAVSSALDRANERETTAVTLSQLRGDVRPAESPTTC